MLEALAKVGMPFIFKGGTSLLLLLEKPRRLSTDIDIIVQPGTDVQSYLIERFWRTLKVDEVYLNDYESMIEARQRIGLFIEQYISIRPHASLEGLTPNMVYFGTKDWAQVI